jgi:hypothetical protein
MGDREQRDGPTLVALDRDWPPLYLAAAVPEWDLRARDQLLLDTTRTPREGDLVVVRRCGKGYLTRFPAGPSWEMIGVVTSMMRLRP